MDPILEMLLRGRQPNAIDPGIDVNPDRFGGIRRPGKLIDPGFEVDPGRVGGSGSLLDPGFARDPARLGGTTPVGPPLPPSFSNPMLNLPPGQPAGGPASAAAPFSPLPAGQQLPGPVAATPLAGIARGEDRPSFGAGSGGVALPPPPDGMLPGMTRGQVPPAGALPGAAPAPFTPRSIDVSPWGSRAVMRQANSREEELSALAEQAGARASANALGTGYMPDGHLLDPRLGMQAASGAASDFLRTAAASDDNATRERMGLAQIMGQKDIAGINAKSRLDEQTIQNKGMVDAARERAGHEHSMGLNKATLDLIGGMATNPAIDPKAIKTAMDFLNSQRGKVGGQPPGVPGLDSLDKGGSTTPGAPAAAAPADPLAGILDVNRGNQVLEQYKSLFAGEGGKTAITPDAVVKMLDRLQTSNPQDKAALIDAIHSGKFGDPVAMQDAILKATAIAKFQAHPPIDPRTNKPVDFRRMGPETVSPFSVSGPNGDPLFTYRVGNYGLGTVLKQPLAGGVPYNQVGADGRWLDISPTDLQPKPFGVGIGQQPSADVLGGRAYHGADLLQELIARSKAQRR